MLRARLASLALAGTLLVSSGCSSFWCDGGGPFNRCASSWFGGRTSIMAAAPVSGHVGGSDCECANGGVVGSTNFHEGAMVVPQGSFVTPQGGVAPMPTPVSGSQQPPQNGQAPRIITMPNAPATPYNP